MSTSKGGEKCNLITYYSEGDDTHTSYGRHRFLAQTFTLTTENAIYLARVKIRVDTITRPQFYSIYHTDITGKPTGAPLFETILNSTFTHKDKEVTWRRATFDDFPILPPGQYALVLSVPSSPDWLKYYWRRDQSSPTYPGGKAFISHNDGVDWAEIPDSDFMFEIWGWQPPPEPPPAPVINNWAPLALELPEVPEDFTIIVTTDIPVHLFMRWTNVEPLKHPLERFRRGIRLMDDTRYCFVAWEENEQIEPGDTLIHTFIKPNWQICETRWFYFIGTKQAEESPSASPIFYFHRKGVEMYVISLGKLTEAEILHGHVKLKEGTGITITRDDPNNALEIIADAVPYEGFGDHWLKYDPIGQLAASLVWRFDEVSFAISGVGIDLRLYTAGMRSWGFLNPCTCEFKLTRGIAAAGNPYIYAAIVGATADIKNNMNQQCIGWMTDPDGHVSCFNGNGVNFTKTDFAWTNWPPVWLKWVLSATNILFYANGVLVATHNTNLPTLTNSCFFALQGYGTSAYPRGVYMTRPHYSAD